MADAFASTFFLFLFFSDISSFFLICLTSELSKAGNCLLSIRRVCLFKPTNNLLLFSVLLSGSLTNQEDSSSRYPRLEICIPRLIMILSTTKVSNNLSKSSPSHLQLAVISNCYKSIAICYRFCRVTWLIMMLFSFRNIF